MQVMEMVSGVGEIITAGKVALFRTVCLSA